MKIPEKMESVSIWFRTEIKEQDEVNLIAGGLISKVDFEFGKQGYSVSDAFVIGSSNGFDGEFYITINPRKTNGDSLIDIIDEDLAGQNEVPTLESLTRCLVEAIKNRKRLPYAFVYRSKIPGLDFLENLVVKEDSDVYILKLDISNRFDVL